MLQGSDLRVRQKRGHCWWVLLVLWSGFCVASFAQSSAPATRQVPAAAHAVTQLTPAQQAQFTRARAAAERILATAEFQQPEPTLWDRIKQVIFAFITRLFMGIDRVTSESPWVGRALEWLLFGAAAVGLLVWVLRTLQRQRLRVDLGREPAKAAEWARKRDDWRQLAEESADKGAWREAIHAVYWASIAELEGRRLWRQNPARTPREYVRLLRPGTAEQRELRGLTATLERSWYGQREGTREEFAEAKQRFDNLAGATTAGGEA